MLIIPVEVHQLNITLCESLYELIYHHIMLVQGSALSFLV